MSESEATMRQILYFVGAGMTKALQQSQEKPVPMMSDFINVMASYAEHDDTILTSLAFLESAEPYP